MTITLKAIHLVDEGSYLVTGSSYTSLEVDGIPVQQATFVVSDLSSVLDVRQIPGVITNYENESGEVKTTEDYQLERDKLTANATKDSYGGYTFTDLDEEYAFRKFTKTWKPVKSEPKVEKLPVEFQVTEVRINSGDPDIVSLWNAPSMGADSHLYSLDRNKISIPCFKTVCEELGLKYHNPSHSGVRFATIEGKYVFDDALDFGRYKFVGTLEQCKQEKKRIMTLITTRVKLLVAKENNVSLIRSAEVLNDLKTIIRQVSKVKPMKTSNSQHFTSIQLIRELISKVEKDLLTEGS